MGKIAKDKRDIYYRLAKQYAFRSRSAFKLMQIEQKFQILKKSRYIVDLCAAPGGWTQIASKYKDKSNGKIISVDLQKMESVEDACIIIGDITHQKTINEILNETGKNLVDVVLCDGAPDLTNFVEFDIYIQSQLVLSSLNIAIRILSEGGSFICKLFRGSNTKKLVNILKNFFEKVEIAKPKASRNASFEVFLVCQGFNKKDKFLSFLGQEMENQKDVLYLNSLYDKSNLYNELNNIEFSQVGDHQYDSDKTYRLEETNYSEILKPLHMPINPPYKMYLDKFKGKNSLNSSDTKI